MLKHPRIPHIFHLKIPHLNLSRIPYLSRLILSFSKLTKPLKLSILAVSFLVLMGIASILGVAYHKEQKRIAPNALGQVPAPAQDICTREVLPDRLTEGFTMPVGTRLAQVKTSYERCLVRHGVSSDKAKDLPFSTFSKDQEKKLDFTRTL